MIRQAVNIRITPIHHLIVWKKNGNYIFYALRLVDIKELQGGDFQVLKIFKDKALVKTPTAGLTGKSLKAILLTLDKINQTSKHNDGHRTIT